MTVLLAAFLAAHGLVHLAIWLPRPAPDSGKAPPFRPDHSWLLTAAALPRVATRQLSSGLAAGAAAGYLLAAIAVGIAAPWARPVTIAAALLGLALKAVFFHPWLAFGILIDAAVLCSALLGWPVALS